MERLGARKDFELEEMSARFADGIQGFLAGDGAAGRTGKVARC
jgi:hypothetical protein